MPESTLALLFELLFNSSGLAELAAAAREQDLGLGGEEWLLVKNYVVKRAMPIPFMMFTALENMRLAVPLLCRRPHVLDFVRLKYKTFNQFVGRLMSELRKADCF